MPHSLRRLLREDAVRPDPGRGRSTRRADGGRGGGFQPRRRDHQLRRAAEPRPLPDRARDRRPRRPQTQLPPAGARGEVMAFRDLPIRRKLTAIIMATSSASLLLACCAFLLHDLVSFRRLLVADLSTLAEIIGSNSSAAIVFSDPKRAGET